MSEEKKETTIEIPHVIKLSVPVEWGKDEDKRSEITVNRRLKARDFKGIQANNIRFDDMLRLVSKITGESIKFIEELDAMDMFAAVEVVNSFLPHGQRTGENQ